MNILIKPTVSTRAKRPDLRSMKIFLKTYIDTIEDQ